MKIYPGDVERLVKFLDQSGAPKRAGETMLSLEGRVCALLETPAEPELVSTPNCPRCGGELVIYCDNEQCDFPG